MRINNFTNKVKNNITDEKIGMERNGSMPFIDLAGSKSRA